MQDPTDFIVIPKIHVVYFSQSPRGKVIQEGTLNITAHNLLFYNQDTTLTLLYTLFEKIEKHVLQDGARCQLLIKTKTFMEYKFELPSQEEMVVIAKSIERLSNIQDLGNIDVYFPLLYHPRVELTCPLAYPWNGYSDILSRWECPPGKFIVSDINRRFNICPSYPPEFIVPAMCDEDVLMQSAKFRHASRFPIVVYYHKKTGATLLRAGQPLVGAALKRCEADRRLLNACLVFRQRGRILDTRTKSVASQWVSKGGGVEQPGMYPHWLLEYCDLERPEGMAESYEKLYKLCFERDTPSSGAHWFTSLGNTKWYSYVMQAIQTALKLAGFLETDGSSVLVHGAKGTDNTLLLTSLAQMIIDPYTRTLEGFLELIIREWVMGGYPFRRRTAGLLENTKEKGRAPTFLLFLDCVWQIMRQYVRSFEFKETLLHLIHEHTHASEYGTFLGDSMKERSEHNLDERTSSLWAYIHSVRDLYLNPMFEENLTCLWPATYPLCLPCWDRMYLKDSGLEEETLHFEKKIKEIYDTNKRLKAEARRLEEIYFKIHITREDLENTDKITNDTSAEETIKETAETTKTEKTAERTTEQPGIEECRGAEAPK